MENKVSFWQKYQVLISAIAGALVIVVQQFSTQTELDWKAFGLAALTAAAGVIGNEWRGKGVSVMGIIGVVSYAVYTVSMTGTINTQQLIMSVILGMLTLVAPPPKSIGYEKTDIIKQAKKEGEIDVPTPLAPKTKTDGIL